MFKKLKAKIIRKMASDELFGMMTEKQREDVYRKVWFDYVCEDVEGFLIDYNGFNEDIDDITEHTQEQIDGLIEIVAHRYVYDGDCDCNIDYWRNIENLVEEEIKYIEEM